MFEVSLISALSLKTQVEEERKKIQSKYLFLCFTVSKNSDNFLSFFLQVDKMFRYKRSSDKEV